MLPVKTLAFLQREKCEHKSGLFVHSSTIAEVSIRTHTNKYSVRTWTYNTHTIQYCFLYKSKLHRFTHKARTEWETNIWWICERAGIIWQAGRRRDSLCLQGFGVKPWKKKNKTNFSFMWPCNVTNFFIIRPTRCTNFASLFLAWNSTCFGQCLCSSSGVYSLYTQPWYMSQQWSMS